MSYVIKYEGDNMMRKVTHKTKGQKAIDGAECIWYVYWATLQPMFMIHF